MFIIIMEKLNLAYFTLQYVSKLENSESKKICLAQTSKTIDERWKLADEYEETCKRHHFDEKDKKIMDYRAVVGGDAFVTFFILFSLIASIQPKGYISNKTSSQMVDFFTNAYDEFVS